MENRIVCLQSLLTEWRVVFWITFILQMAKMFIFSIWGSGDVQPWNAAGDPDAEPLASDDDDVSECEYADSTSFDEYDFRRYSI